jgi:hypothetical protein
MHSKPENSTVSRFETFQQVYKSTGKEPPELRDRPPFSNVLMNAWEAYERLTEFSYQEIDCFMKLTGHELEYWEVTAIMTLARYREVKPTWPLKQHL